MKGPHFAIGVETSNYEDEACPFSIGFYAGNGEKKTDIHWSKDASPNNSKRIKLGIAKLGSIKLAEGEVINWV